MMKIITLILLSLTFFIGIGACQSESQEIVAFGPKETKINGSIPYTLIGQYKAQFRHFNGRITLDKETRSIQAVDLEIQASSITSNCPWCDRLARSHKLLYAAKYPEIIFKSERIMHDEGGYKVKGILAMHGIQRRMIFPFKARIFDDPQYGQRILDLHGTWVFNRKDFNITWNKLLDRGGIVVGDNITVNWGIKARIQ